MPWSQDEQRMIRRLAPIYQLNFAAYLSFLPGRSFQQVKSYYRNNQLFELSSQGTPASPPAHEEKGKRRGEMDQELKDWLVRELERALQEAPEK